MLSKDLKQWETSDFVELLNMKPFHAHEKKIPM